MSSEENSDDRPITVGVIDDDPMICQAMRLILEDYSTGRLNVVFTCTDGGQAVDEAGRHHPDVVLMDVAMPGMDGIEATRRLRALPQPPHVLILTSLSPSGTVERAIEAGFDAQVDPALKIFFYMPYEHSEALDDQQRAELARGFASRLFHAHRSPTDKEGERTLRS